MPVGLAACSPRILICTLLSRCQCTRDCLTFSGKVAWAIVIQLDADAPGRDRAQRWANAGILYAPKWPQVVRKFKEKFTHWIRSNR